MSEITRKSTTKVQELDVLSFDIDKECFIDTPRIKGTIILNDDGSITLNRGNKSCVTLIGAFPKIANEIITICDTDDSFYNLTEMISMILMEYEIKIMEVERFNSNVKPIIKKRVKELIAKDLEWESLGERDKKDKEKEYIDQYMIDFLDDAPPAMFGALSFLVFNSPIEVPLFKEINSEYGLKNLNTYCQYLGRKNPIISIQNIQYRKPLEDLVKVGLAFTGRDMSAEELLSTLTLSKLNEIALTNTKFTRKDKVIKYLIEKENISSIIEKNITLRSLFSLRPVPDRFKEFDFEKYRMSKYYYEELSTVLVSLYNGYFYMKY